MSDVASGPPSIWGGVPRRNPGFTGREATLEEMATRLASGQRQLVLTSTIGGAGKTHLAVEYVYRHSHEYDAVWWVPSADVESIRASLRDLAHTLGVGADVKSALRALVDGVPARRWLLVFDNASSPREIAPYVPVTSGHVIITSRQAEWATYVDAVATDLFTRAESVQLLRSRRPELTTEEANAVAGALGDLPLAVEQAAAWMAETGMPPSDYLALLEGGRAELADGGPTNDITVAAAWGVALDRLDSGAFELLSLLTYFDAGSVSRNNLRPVPNLETPQELAAVLSDPIALGGALRNLNRYSLVKIDHSAGTLIVHRLVRAVVQSRLDEDTADQLRRLAEVLEDRVGFDVEWSTDSPAEVDFLKRDALAAVLTQRISETRERDPRSSLLIHLDGEWGSGKSTLLNLLGRRLTAAGFLVIWYDAWQQSRLSPPWWALLTTVRRHVAHDRGWWERQLLYARETAARARRSGAPYLLALILLAVFAGGLALAVRTGIGGNGQFSEFLKVFAPVVTAVGVLWTGARIAARVLLWDSARGARLFEQADTNPMGRVAEHFEWLLRRSSKPVVFFVDDLDRCKDTHVVELLESVQTLVRDAPRVHDATDRLPPAAYFVVAADGGWLRRAYTAEHGDTDSLGYQFLDKLFQLTVPMPALSTTGQERFLGRLLGLGDPQPIPPGQIELAKSQIANADGDEEIIVGTLAEMTPELRDAVAVDATRALLGAETQVHREHTLRKFAPLLTPNPRSIKLFLNSYAILRAVRILEGVTVDTDTLALWTILRLRWPAIADVLQRDPDAVRGIIEPLWCSDHFPTELQAVARSADLRTVVTHNPGGPLNANTIRQCCGVT